MQSYHNIELGVAGLCNSKDVGGVHHFHRKTGQPAGNSGAWELENTKKVKKEHGNLSRPSTSTCIEHKSSYSTRYTQGVLQCNPSLRSPRQGDGWRESVTAHTLLKHCHSGLTVWGLEKDQGSNTSLFSFFNVPIKMKIKIIQSQIQF